MKLKLLLFTVLACTQLAFAQNDDFKNALAVPPAQDLLKHVYGDGDDDDDDDEYEYSSGNEIRIWGWSSDGKLAYSLDREIHVPMDFAQNWHYNNFYILDLVDDSYVEDIDMSHATDHDDGDGIAAHGSSEYGAEEELRQRKPSIINAMHMFKITRQGAELMPFPATINGVKYEAELSNIISQDNDYEQNVTQYTVNIIADGKRKVLGTFEIDGYDSIDNVHIAGYFYLPSANRIAVVLAEDDGRFGHISYVLTGCHLGVGFE
ncbi:MAG: hypothetical protein LBV04_09400 [Deferribacteraceae bacterium]|jgi:hypothetical protein|nr:hypothetical protein [Deferribacteraceae bacterium]